MTTGVRRVGIALASFAVAWLVIALVATWLFGSGNVLVWVFAALAGVTVYLVLLRRDRSGG